MPKTEVPSAIRAAMRHVLNNDEAIDEWWVTPITNVPTPSWQQMRFQSWLVQKFRNQPQTPQWWYENDAKTLIDYLEGYFDPSFS